MYDVLVVMTALAIVNNNITEQKSEINTAQALFHMVKPYCHT